MKKTLTALISLCLALLLCVSCTPAPAAPTDTIGTTVTDVPTDTATEAPSAEAAETEAPAPAVSSLNGVELSRFAIVYSAEDADYSLRAAEYIQSEIQSRTGLELALVEDSDESTAAYEIVVGETTRAISARLDADTERTQFAILAEDKQIALEGDYFIIAAAAYFFVETYIPEDNFAATIPTEVTIHDPIVEKAKNFMVLIGDGMGLYQSLLFDVMENDIEYGDGEDRFYGYYLPARGMARTNSLSGTTDSAAAGTALSTGHKTYNEYIGQDADHAPLTSLTELAASLGKSTAVMSTEDSSGATPAAFSAHADDRDYSDEIRSDQKALRREMGTIVACNFNHYTKALVDSRLEGRINLILRTLDQNDEGFFLMYEEAHIDDHCHFNDANMAFHALVRFNQAIGRFMEYAFYHPDTFVLITADHETGWLLPSGDGGFGYNSGDHSSMYVPVFAYGDGSELFDDRVIENIQIPQTIACFMGVEDFGDQNVYGPLTK